MLKEETDAWTTAQADFTRAFLDKNPHRVALENELRANFDFEKVSRVALFKKFILITYMKIVVWDSFRVDIHRPPLKTVLPPRAEKRRSVVLVV